MSSSLSFTPIPKRRLILILLGLLVNAVIISSSFTFFTSFNDFSSNFLGGGKGTSVIYNPAAATVFTGSVPAYLSSQISEIRGVKATSPEVLTAAITLDGKIITVRGISQSFFDMEILSKKLGRIDYLDTKECLIGYRAYQRIGVELNERITLRSTTRNTINEFIPVGVFISDSPMDDEILVPIDDARIMRGLPDTRVTLIRVLLDETILDDETLGNFISKLHRVDVKIASDTSFSSTLEIKQENGKIIERRNIQVPGEINISLPYGKYVFSVKNQEKEVLLDSDQVISFQVNQNINKIEITVTNAVTGSVGESRILIENRETSLSEEYSSENGRFQVYLATGEYVITSFCDGYQKTQIINISENTAIDIVVGPIPLNIQVYDSESQTPIRDALIEVKGEENYVSISNNFGSAFFQLPGGEYQITVSKGDLVETKKVEIKNEKTILLILGQETAYDLGVIVSWSNHTSIKDVYVTVTGETLTWTGYTDKDGYIKFSDLPQDRYSVFVEKDGITFTSESELISDQELEIIIPAAILFESDISPDWIRYLPQTVTVTLSDAMFKNSMRILVSLITSTLWILASLFTVSTIINSVDIIQNSISESSRTIGILRSIGATKSKSTRMFGQGLVLASVFVGVIGYFIGFIAIFIASKYRFFVLAGYVLEPKLNYSVLAASTMICPLITILALYLKFGDLHKLEIMTLLKSLRKSDILQLPRDTLFSFAAFTIPFLVRAIPEIIVYPFSIGYDTVSAYIPALVALQRGFENQVFDFIYQRPFFWILASLPYPFDSASPFKFFPVLLHGLLGLSIFTYAKEISKDNIKSLAISLLSTIYFISLRVSWDLFGNEMGLILVFFSLTVVTRGFTGWGSVILALTAFTATVLTHEAASMLLFVASIPLLYESYKKQGKKGAFRWMVVILPTFLFFIYRLSILDFPMITNPMYNVRYPSETYARLVQSVSTLYVYVILPILPISILGLRAKKRSNPLIFWFLGATLAALSPIISPYLAFTFWTRWAYMTAYPLCFYAVEGIYSLKKVKIQLNLGKPRETSLRTVFSAFFIVVMLLMSGTFLMAPTTNYQPYHTIYGAEAAWIVRHVPSSMLLSTVPPSYAQEAKTAIEWVNENTTDTIVLLVDEEIRGYTALYCDHERILIRDLGVPWYSNPDYREDTEKSAENYAAQGYEVYLIARHFDLSGFTIILNGSYLNVYKYQ